MKTELFVRFTIVVVLVVAITDSIVFYVMQRRHRQMTWPLLIATIIITIIPIVIQLWFWLIYKK